MNKLYINSDFFLPVFQTRTTNTKKGGEKNRMRRKRGRRKGRISLWTKSNASTRKMTRETTTTRSRRGRSRGAMHVRQRSVRTRAQGGVDGRRDQERSNKKGKEEKQMFKTESGRERETDGGTERVTTRERGREIEKSKGVERGITRTETGTERRGGGDKSWSLSTCSRDELIMTLLFFS